MGRWCSRTSNEVPRQTSSNYHHTYLFLHGNVRRLCLWDPVPVSLPLHLS